MFRFRFQGLFRDSGVPTEEFDWWNGGLSYSEASTGRISVNNGRIRVNDGSNDSAWRVVCGEGKREGWGRVGVENRAETEFEVWLWVWIYVIYRYFLGMNLARGHMNGGYFA